MDDDVRVEMMTSDLILWRCLHGGPLAADTMMKWKADDPMPWMELCERNVPLLKKLTQAYGACAVVARHGAEFVGQLRFYPKVVQRMCTSDELEFCMQQKFPHGPDDRFAEREFPALEELTDRTLVVHCIMTGSPQRTENPYQRRGLGTRMVRFLVQWARARGWEAIEAKTHEDIPLLYTISGCAGRTFWEKLGFRVARTATEKYFLEDAAFAKALRESAAAVGVDPSLVTNTYTMRLDL